MTLSRSWVASANSPDTPFPLNNLPYGVFSVGSGARRLGVAIGDQILDVASVVDALPVDAAGLTDPRGWNGVMELETSAWDSLRTALTALLAEGTEARSDVLVPQDGATLHLPFTVTEFTDF